MLPRGNPEPLMAHIQFRKNKTNNVFIPDSEEKDMTLTQRARNLNHLTRQYHIDVSPTNKLNYLKMEENRLGKSRGDELRIPGINPKVNVLRSSMRMNNVVFNEIPKTK